MSIEWTTAQRQAIATTGRSLLVSAAAGSGKTAVLAERCVYLACDAPDPCNIDQLLVVTFTETAAAEMRRRIQKALTERADAPAPPSPRILRQLALVEHAHISTIHGFCAQLLRQNFSLAGIDPQFKVIDADEAMLLRREVAGRLFDDRYQRDPAGRFRAFVDAYGQGRDEPLIDQVCRTYELLCSLAFPRKWMSQTMDRLAGAAEAPLAQSELGQALLSAVQTALNRLQQRCGAAVTWMQKLKTFPAHVARLKEWATTIDGWQQTFGGGSFDDLVAEFKTFDPPRAPPINDTTPGKEQARSLLDSIKRQMREGDLADLLAFTSAQWRQGQQTIVPHASTFMSLVDEFAHRYGLAKAQMRGLDFSDLEQKALGLLRAQGEPEESGGDLLPSTVARSCHWQYQHVLVDEYQDVNQIQDSILDLISTECIAHEGHYSSNLFAVGDVKQSIYRFRLAEPQRFLERARRFRLHHNDRGSVIDLRDNFRGRPQLLEGINFVFERLMTEEAAEIEYDQSHRLRAGINDAAGDAAGDLGGIELHLLADGRARDDDDLDHTEIEATVCAHRILELVAGSQAKFGDMAILLRSMKKKADRFTKILRQHGIAVHNSGGSGFFEATEIRDMTGLLALLDNQRQDIPLAAFLRGPLAALPQSENAMTQVRLAYDAKTIPFHQAVVLYAAEKGDAVAQSLAASLGRLSHWRDVARQRPLGELIWQLYEETAYLTYVAGLDDGAQRVANLLYLHQRARQFGSFLKQGLHRFRRFLSELSQETDLSLPSISNDSEQAVAVMSIHRSKGLEFPIVIVPDLGKRHNLADASGSILLDRRSGAGFKVVDPSRRIRYPSLSWTLTRDSLRRQTLAEELRLLYVAMTRARNRLILVGTAHESASANWASQYAGHQGPLPCDDILSAATLLDWIGAVQAIGGDKIIKRREYRPEEIAAWNAAAQPAARTDRLNHLAALKPLDPPPPINEQAAAAIARLEYTYPHQPSTARKAAAAATSLAENLTGPNPTGPTATAEFTISPTEELALAPFLSAQPAAALSAAQIGEATHLVLEHLDYQRPCDRADVEAQIETLIQRRLIDPLHAAAVDRHAIAWLAASELGLKLRANAGTLLRELPFAAVEAAAGDDPADATMIRGRIDLVIPQADGVSIVDYKTDRITAEQAAGRAQEYKPQMDSYRRTLQAVGRRSVKAVYLVFLHPQVIFKFSAHEWARPASP